MRLAPWLLLAVLFAPATSSAQILGNPLDVTSSGTSYRVFAQPGEPTVQVLVLGQGATGMYIIGADTDLVELLALTGTGASEVTSDEVARTVTVRLMREQGGQRAVVYEREFDDFLSDPGSYPSLQDGDVFTVEVEQRRRFGAREVLDVTSRLASITLLVIRLIDVL